MPTGLLAGPWLYNPYFNCTGYAPVNTAYNVVDPGRWQPDVQCQGLGLYKVQQFITPQYALVEPDSFADATQFGVIPPFRSNPAHTRLHKWQPTGVLDGSAT